MSFSWHRQGSRRLARLIVGAVASRIGLPGRGVHEAGFYLLRRSEMPAALLESAFLSSMHDARLLRRALFRRKIASGIATGIDRFFSRPWRQQREHVCQTYHRA